RAIVRAVYMKSNFDGQPKHYTTAIYSDSFLPLSHRTKMVEKFSRQESFYSDYKTMIYNTLRIIISNDGH
ncbi:MAG: hypothetical protein Q4A76_10840, partial [Porphyromonadaceae bacterium]|nr:hypothetical protein [Porphyromonadaceae bacterium]